jgi:hypothetical protein
MHMGRAESRYRARRARPVSASRQPGRQGFFNDGGDGVGADSVGSGSISSPRPSSTAAISAGKASAATARFGNELQRLTPTHAKAQQFAQAFGRHRVFRRIDDAHSHIAFETLGQLREDLRRARMQDRGHWPALRARSASRWHVTAQRLQDRALLVAWPSS